MTPGRRSQTARKKGCPRHTRPRGLEAQTAPKKAAGRCKVWRHRNTYSLTEVNVCTDKRDLALFVQPQKSSNLSWRGSHPQTPPPQVGRCRGLQGCAMAKGCCDRVNGLECSLECSQVSSNQACRFGTFFSGPHSGTLLGLCVQANAGNA